MTRQQAKLLKIAWMREAEKRHRLERVNQRLREQLERIKKNLINP